ncbi:hypothetical protein GCM10010182_78790 [Actinomadura cremea]|nr:hypothetical protein GCM10010182_78790 [Actinomadura cremea]
MISLGSGGNRFSSAIAIPAPGAPICSIRSVAQPAMPPTGSPSVAAKNVIVIMPRHTRDPPVPATMERTADLTGRAPQPGPAENRTLAAPPRAVRAGTGEAMIGERPAPPDGSA